MTQLYSVMMRSHNALCLIASISRLSLVVIDHTLACPLAVAVMMFGVDCWCQ